MEEEEFIEIIGARAKPMAAKIAPNGLATNAQQTAAITCPYGTSDPTSLVTITLTYGTPQQGVVHALYANN